MNNSKEDSHPLTIEAIERLLKIRYEGLQKDPRLITSEFNNTEQTRDSYNGRSVLEMLQNADDAGANFLKIEINEEERSLIFSNDGEHPFSEEGFDSLLHAHLSSKSNREDNIGQKGLGIRSLLNLSRTIRIFSNGVFWYYADEHRKDFVDKIESLEHDIGETRFLEWKRKTPNYLEQIPLFLVPRYGVCDKDEYTTKIELLNLSEENLNQIDYEIKKLKANVLLFLKNIKRIYINKNGDWLNYEIEKNEHNISILHTSKSNGESKKSEWIIYRNPKIDFKGKEKLEIGVAYPVDGNLPQEERRIYSYLPTGICLDLPLIIHARFSLSADRNNLNNDSEGRNKYLIEELVKLISETAIDRANSNREYDWKPYEMLALNDKKKDNPILEELGFYSELEKCLETSKIYPCLDNVYRAEGEFVNYGNDFSEFLLKNELGAFYPNQIKPYPSSIEVDSCREGEDKSFIDKINIIANHICEASVISEFIYILINNNDVPKFSNYGYVYNILRDEDGCIITPKEDMKIFTSKSENGVPIKIPPYARSYIKFINAKINRCLIEQFSLIGENNPNRSLQRELRKLFGKSVYEYDRSNIPENLISIAVKRIDSETDFSCKEKILGEMYDYLYENCQESLPEISFLKNGWPTIPAMSKANIIVDNIKELFIPEEYPIASSEGRIFGNSRDAGKYFKLPKGCELINKDKKLIGSFLSGIGANVYVKFEKVGKDTEITYEEYGRFLKSELNLEDYLKAPEGLSNINNISEILKLDPEKFLLLCYKSSEILRFLDNNCADSIYLMGARRGLKRILTDPHPSYLKFILCKKGPFHDYILHSVYKKFNSINLNEEDVILKEISSKDKKDILRKLGAVDDISDLSMERIKEIISDLPKTSPDGKNVQNIYFEAVKAFIKSGKEFRNTLSDIEGLRLLTKSREYVDRKSVYLGRGSIPKSLAKKRYILDFPARELPKESVLSFFGISELNKNEIEILGNITGSCDASFINRIEELKPFMLAFRLKCQDLSPTTKENSVNNIKKFNLVIVENGLKYKFGDEEFSMEEGDVIENSGNKIFYLSMSNRENISDSDLSIALYEVYNSIFNLSYNEDDAVVFEKFIMYPDWVRKNHPTVLEEAHMLLENEDKHRKIFYEKLSDKIKDIEDFEFLKKQLNYTGKRSVKDVSDISRVLRLYSVSIEDFNEFAKNELALYEYHIFNFNEIVTKKIPIAEQVFWYRAKKNTELQKNFIADLNRYRNLSMKFSKLEIEYELKIDYNSHLSSLFKQEFGVDFVSPSEYIDIEKQYEDNYKRSIGLNENCLDDEKKSLLFFNPIKLKMLQRNNRDDSTGNNISCFTLEEVSIKPSVIKASGNNHRRKLGNAGYNDRKNKEIGRKAEDIAFESYKRQYPDGDVKKHSSNAVDGCDGLGYDITYIDKDENLHYVEVKHYTSEYIFISEAEKESALKLLRYEIALVSDSKIYVIRDPFNFKDGESFEKNSKFTAEVDNWKLYLLPDSKV